MWTVKLEISFLLSQLLERLFCWCEITCNETDTERHVLTEASPRRGKSEIQLIRIRVWAALTVLSASWDKQQAQMCIHVLLTSWLLNIHAQTHTHTHTYTRGNKTLIAKKWNCSKEICQLGENPPERACWRADDPFRRLFSYTHWGHRRPQKIQWSSSQLPAICFLLER